MYLIYSRCLSDYGVRSETIKKNSHFFDILRRIVSLFNDKSAGLPICTDKVRPEGVWHKEVLHVKERESEEFFHCRSRIIHNPTDT